MILGWFINSISNIGYTTEFHLYKITRYPNICFFGTNPQKGFTQMNSQQIVRKYYSNLLFIKKLPPTFKINLAHSIRWIEK